MHGPIKESYAGTESVRDNDPHDDTGNTCNGKVGSLLNATELSQHHHDVDKDNQVADEELGDVPDDRDLGDVRERPLNVGITPQAFGMVGRV